MIHWLWTAINTYLLHSEHANGYAFWSAGPGPGLGQITLVGGLLVYLRRHNCHIHRCWRLQWHEHPAHGHPVCRRHHPHDARVLPGPVIRDTGDRITETTEGGDW